MIRGASIGAIVLPVAFWALVWVPPAFAQSDGSPHHGGSLGLGGQQTLGGFTGVAARLHVSGSFGLGAVVGLHSVVTDGGGGQTDTDTDWLLALRGDYVLAGSRRAALALGAAAGLVIATRVREPPMMPAQSTTAALFYVEVPLSVEYYVAEHFSIGAAVGAILYFIPDDAARPIFSSVGYTATAAVSGFGIVVGAAPLLSAGFTFYF